jgi:hypothetical protein
MNVSERMRLAEQTHQFSLSTLSLSGAILDVCAATLQQKFA